MGQQPRIFNGTQWVEYNTEGELQAAIDALCPPNRAIETIIQNQFIREQAGRELIRTLGQTLDAQNLTQAEEADIVTRISGVVVALSTGWLRGARVICNALTIGGALTNARKNYLLNQIDAVIAQLP